MHGPDPARHRRASLLAAAILLTAAGLCAASERLSDAGVEQAGGGALVKGAPALHLRAGLIDTSAAKQGLGTLAGPGSAGAHFVVQLDGPMTPDRRRRMEAAGVAIGDYLPESAFIVTLDRADPKAVGTLEFIRWFDRYHGEWKVDPEVGGRIWLTPERLALAKAGRSLLDVTLFDGEPADGVRRAIAKIPGAIVHRTEVIAGNAEIAVTINSPDIKRLAAMAQVQFIEEAPEITLRNNTDRWIVQSNIPNVTPLYDHGLHGEGQVVGILDEKVDSTHCSLSDAVNPIGPLHRKILAYNTTLGAGTHGTHVAGIVVGDNGVFDDLRGVAYLGKLVCNDIPAFTEVATSGALQTHHNQGARVHTNSWGDDGTTAYNSLCRGFDSFLYANEDSMVTLAVTNQAALKNPENAKNLLAVGATQDAPNQANHCYGGVGPTSDLRRKPEIYAPGCGIVSAGAGTGCGTATLSGTSMATPAVAGAALLTRQYYTAGYYPSGVADAGAAITPTGALVKATLLNSAVDLTGVTGYPSNQEGWGRVLADDALYFPGDARRLVIRDVRNASGLFTGGGEQVQVNVLSSSQRLKVTLVWTDPAGASGALLAPINDLDLVVTGPTGATYLGNVFAAGVSVTGGTRDSLNNVEQVHVDSPAAGAWTVQVSGTAVNQGTQGYALVVTGDIQGVAQGLTISLAAPAPTLVAPGASPTIDVNINPGVDTLVAGSPTLFYRYAPGAFFSVPLQAVSGMLYRASIPTCLCGDGPQFYASAAGVSGGVRTAPSNAPAALYSFAVGALQTTTILDERFPTGLPALWSATGLWHATAACAVSPACEAAPWMAYNADGTCTYNTGAANVGSLTSPLLAVPSNPAGGAVTLSYCCTVQTENVAAYDRHRLYANTTVVDAPPESAGAWQTRAVDLSGFAGQSVTLRWEFDTVDATANNFRGWQVDKVVLTASTVVCTPICRVDVDQSGTIAPADVAMFINTWFASLTNGTLAGDFDRDGAVTPADVAAFVNVWFAALTTGSCP